MSEIAVVDTEHGVAEQLAAASNMTLIARDPAQLQSEQQRLIAWCDAKMAEVEAVYGELSESIEHHRKLKWSTRTLQNALRREGQRIEFYGKVRDALDAGFYIVPNFPCDVFAIRTDREAEGYRESTYSAGAAIANLPEQKAEVLPVGDGEYRNASPQGKITDITTTPKQNGTETRWLAEAVGYRPLEFPFAFAKPEVLTATQHAMALKIFDELCVLPSRTKKSDPMIIGRIIRPWERKQWETPQRHLSFLIVWWLDTATI